MAKKKTAQPDLSESATTTLLVDGADTAPAGRAAPNVPLKFQAFERIVTARSKLLLHERNPRSIDPHAFKKLCNYLKKQKLLGSIQVNRRLSQNGFPEGQHGQMVIIGGNQRTRAMDKITGYPDAENSDYQVPCEVSELTPAAEVEAVIALNNPGMMGSFDYDILADLLTTPGVDPLATGFDRVELAAFIDEGMLEEILGPAAARQASAESPILDELNAIADTGRAQDRADRQAAAAQQPSASAGPPSAQDDIDGMKARRSEYQEQINQDTNSAGFMIVLVADTEDEVRKLLARLNLPVGQDFYPLSAFLERLGVGEEG